MADRKTKLSILLRQGKMAALAADNTNYVLHPLLVDAVACRMEQGCSKHSSSSNKTSQKPFQQLK